MKKKRRGKDRKKRREQQENPADLSMMPSDGSSDRSYQSVGSTYQVGEIDESGFVHLGIEERQVRPSRHEKQMNRTFFGIGGAGNLESSSGYSSSGYSSNESSQENKSKYKKSLDFLVEQGVMVRE